MYSLATRSAARRIVITPVSRTIVVAKRYSSTEHDNDPQVIEIEKQRNLRKEQHKTSTPIKNAPGWNQYLASASEAAVKADRSDSSPSDLTSETLKHVKARHHATDSPSSGSLFGEERVDALEASYERDDSGSSGPLKHTTPKEHVERQTYKKSVSRTETDLPGGV